MLSKFLPRSEIRFTDSLTLIFHLKPPLLLLKLKFVKCKLHCHSVGSPLLPDVESSPQSRSLLLSLDLYILGLKRWTTIVDCRETLFVVTIVELVYLYTGWQVDGNIKLIWNKLKFTSKTQCYFFDIISIVFLVSKP